MSLLESNSTSMTGGLSDSLEFEGPVVSGPVLKTLPVNTNIISHPTPLPVLLFKPTGLESRAEIVLFSTKSQQKKLN